ncbi:MAG: hypothetical protein ACR2LV_02615 [Solirubrobacteraceae bacterium]
MAVPAAIRAAPRQRVLSARADGVGQLSVEDCFASAAADAVERQLANVRCAAAHLRQAELARAHAKDRRDQAIVAAAQAGASVRALGHAADIGKTQASEIARRSQGARNRTLQLATSETGYGDHASRRRQLPLLTAQTGALDTPQRSCAVAQTQV